MKLWGGRFNKDTEKAVERFTASIQFDQRLYRQDILGSIAHCRMLAKQGIISSQDCQAIVAGLLAIMEEIDRGEFPFSVELEDIHMNVESRLREKIGAAAGKLHTARSRNDQVALDVRMYTREATLQTVEKILGLQRTLILLAEQHVNTIMPGYTHLQRAQPIVLAHHLLAYVEMLRRDAERFQDCYRRCDQMPLGAAALAGTPFEIDREAVARELGFSGVSRNSIDAVADRDFVVEFISASAVAMMHLSRLSEEIVLWSTSEFGFLELDDAFSTGSSIMPQKKNPDVAELVRGKTGRVYGHLIALLTILKGLPLAYNKDLQEDKEALFDTFDTTGACLEMLAGLLGSSMFNVGRMRASADESLSVATDLADYLVVRGLPFRQAHEVVGRLVSYCLQNKKTLGSVTLEEYLRFSPLFDSDVSAITVESSVRSRSSQGGTSPLRVAEAVCEARDSIEETSRWVEAQISATLDVEQVLEERRP
ncbi:MAG: argininosuccinate lyase [Chloroflexi bacterium]|nr:argininosuccinate lyase [Chloroflexota bacterium]